MSARPVGPGLHQQRAHSADVVRRPRTYRTALSGPGSQDDRPSAGVRLAVSPTHRGMRGCHVSRIGKLFAALARASRRSSSRRDHRREKPAIRRRAAPGGRATLVERTGRRAALRPLSVAPTVIAFFGHPGHVTGSAAGFRPFHVACTDHHRQRRCREPRGRPSWRSRCNRSRWSCCHALHMIVRVVAQTACVGPVIDVASAFSKSPDRVVASFRLTKSAPGATP